MPATVRRAGPADAGAVAPLFDAYRQFYGLAPDPQLCLRFLTDRLARGESLVLLAEQPGGAPAGFAQLYPTFSSLSAARVLVLYDLFVAPQARRSGVGRALMEAAARLGREQGAASLVLSTARTNRAAQRLYESLGWLRDEDFYEYHLRL